MIVMSMDKFWYCNLMLPSFRIGLLCLTMLLCQQVWAVSVSVHLEGLGQKLRSHVLSYLDINQAKDKSDLSQAQLQRLYEQAPEQIKTALQVYGYYQAQVSASLKQEDETWIARFEIKPGIAIRIDSVEVGVSGPGQDNPALKAALKIFPIHKGQVLVQPRYDTARDALYRTAITQGYLDARFVRREVRVDLHSYRVSIVLQLQTGVRYFFGQVTFKQNAMSEAFLRHYIRFKTGDPYNPATLLQLQTNLSDSGLFQSVEVTPIKAQAVANQVPIEITITARKRHQWRFGLGYATDTGARGSIDFNQLVGSQGDKFETRLLESQAIRSLSAGYTIPLANPVKDQMSFGVRYSDEITDGRESLISGLSASQTSAWKGWQRVISLNYDREVYTIGGEPEATGRALYPMFSLSKIQADNRVFTRNGYRIYFELRGANKNLLSDTNYAQVRLGMKWIHSLSDDSRLLLRGDFGSTNVAYLSEMPLSQRFFAGGDNSVRGYAYNSLGPKDSFGNVVGGKQLIVGSVEYDHRIVDNWSGAVFYDIGNAINSMSDPLDVGVGFGVHWDSPVGPVRFDFAWGLDKPSHRFRLHIVIGPDL